MLGRCVPQMKPINKFLLDNEIRISRNPCVSPDFCLDWEVLQSSLRSNQGIDVFPLSHFETGDGKWSLVSDESGDHAWRLESVGDAASGCGLQGRVEIDGATYFPASFENLIAIKNRIQEFESESSIFPTAEGSLGKSTLGIGARFTTLHWPGVDWTMANLGIGLTANQNSIPRELVFDVDVMLANELDKVPFPFIGTSVPEGHQGQSVEGMSHGCVLSKLKTGFHSHRIAWSFNADHQPIGGKFDSREDALVAGCLFASYITFDLSPELAETQIPETEAEQRSYVDVEIDSDLVAKVSERVAAAGITLDETERDALLCYVWPAMKKMKARDGKYRRAREAAFTTEVGRAYLRELSIDELPGLTKPETTGIMLALCEVLGMPVQFVAPAFGFQKNMPYPSNGELKDLIARQWKICEAFGVSIGFHSGSGKSAENYQVMGEVTGGNLEIKTSGRYTYEMGLALSESKREVDQALWRDWYAFSLELAVVGAFSLEETERSMARDFIVNALELEGAATQVFDSLETCRSALEALVPNPGHMFWFEYNFLFVLAREGLPRKETLGDHSAAGYQQRERFYSISDEGRLRFCQKVASYIIFLARNTGLAKERECDAAQEKLSAYTDYSEFLEGIANPNL